MKTTWTTKSGEKINICLMTDDHLINTINFIKRKAVTKLDCIINNPPCFQGEMAQYHAESEWESYLDIPLEDFIDQHYPIYFEMIKEAEKRKLNYEKV